MLLSTSLCTASNIVSKLDVLDEAFIIKWGPVGGVLHDTQNAVFNGTSHRPPSLRRSTTFLSSGFCVFMPLNWEEQIIIVEVKCLKKKHTYTRTHTHTHTHFSVFNLHLHVLIPHVRVFQSSFLIPFSGFKFLAGDVC